MWDCCCGYECSNWWWQWRWWWWWWQRWLWLCYIQWWLLIVRAYCVHIPHTRVSEFIFDFLFFFGMCMYDFSCVIVVDGEKIVFFFGFHVVFVYSVWAARRKNTKWKHWKYSVSNMNIMLILALKMIIIKMHEYKHNG